MAAAEQLGDGWRLPTQEEFVQLCDLGSTWDEDRKGRWFGGNHETDHEGSLFLPAAGSRTSDWGVLAYVGTYGHYWCSSSDAYHGAGYLWLGADRVYPVNYSGRPVAFSVRYVRNIQQANPTIILPSLPGLEWMTENLQGYGGTEIDGRTYYTWEEAMAAAEQLGDGWRLPTPDEWDALCDLGSVWQERGPHGSRRLFGGGVFLDAAGWLDPTSGALTYVGTYGSYWSSLSYVVDDQFAGGLSFSSNSVGARNNYDCDHGFSVRCVRDVE